MPRAKGSAAPEKRMARMTPVERAHMLEWLALPRPGSGLPMLCWRWIYGAAAKGQNMNGSAEDVHASAGYTSLAKYVNHKSSITSNKFRAWTAETAEKRWTYLKSCYRKACFLPAPDMSDDYENEMALYAQKQDQACGDFLKLHALMKDHPGTKPAHTRDSMTELRDNEDDLDNEDGNDDDGDSVINSDGDVQSNKSNGSKTTVVSKETAETTTASDASAKKRKTTRQDLAAKKPFYLKKPTSEPSAKPPNVQTLFIHSQMQLAENNRTQMRVTATLDLLRANVPKEEIPELLAIMFASQEADATAIAAKSML
jgi:hypothetical protein